jgi:hypothetical protein
MAMLLDSITITNYAFLTKTALIYELQFYVGKLLSPVIKYFPEKFY